VEGDAPVVFSGHATLGKRTQYLSAGVILGGELGMAVGDTQTNPQAGVDAAKRLIPFETWLTEALSKSSVLHADETGINVNGKRHWLHCNSNASLTVTIQHPA